MVVFVGNGSYLRSPSVVCVAEEGERGGASPDSGRMVSGACAWCVVPMKALGRVGRIAEGAWRRRAVGYSIYKVTRARKGVALW